LKKIKRADLGKVQKHTVVKINDKELL